MLQQKIMKEIFAPKISTYDLPKNKLFQKRRTDSG